jgi:hypothetical protein
MGWLGNLFSPPRRKAEYSNSTSYHDLEGAPVPLQPAAVDIRSARDVVHQAAMKTAQMHGIPPGWLTFEVLTIADAKQAYFQLQVVMNIWDEYLALHASAFQNAVIKRIRDENVEVGRAVRAVLWRVAPEAGCPYDDMPQAQAWSADAVKKRAMVRERMHREMYAMSVPASGAVLDAATHRPAGAKEPAQADGVTAANKHDHLLDDSAFGDTRPSSFNGFAATQPYAPLMDDIIEHPKK